MAHYGPEEYWYPDGTLATNVRAAVFDGDQNTFSSIFSDVGMTVPLANPTTTDGAGLLEFYAAAGDYWIFVGGEGDGDGNFVTIPPSSPGGVTSVNGQTGVVVLTASDVGAQPIATIDAKGDLYAGTGSDATTRLPVGTNGQVLSANSGQATGLEWIAAPGGAVDSVNGQTGIVVLNAADVGADPAGSAAAAAAASQPLATINAKGDIYAGTANDTTTRLGVGSDGQVLTAASGQATGLIWSTPAADAVTSVNGQTGVVVLTSSDVGAQPIATIDAKGDLYAGTGSDATTRLPVGTDGQVLTAASGQATGLTWSTPAADAVTSVNGQTGVVVLTSASVGAQPIATIDAKGDIYAGTGADATTRLPVGTDGQVLTAASGQATGLQWSTPAADAVTSVNGQTGVVVLTAASVSAVPTTRTVTAGTALTGGGALSSDITINANVGTSAGTVAAGDDSRITGAQQRSTLTTKGDLYAATASATTTRVGVGTDGQVLTAASGQASGLTWSTPAAKTVTTTIEFGDDRLSVSTGTGVSRWYNRQAQTLTINSCWIAAGVVPTGANLIIDVNLNGTTIYTTQGNRPTITASTNGGAATVPDVTSIAPGDYLTFDIDQIGSSAAGGQLSGGVVVSYVA